MKRNVLLGSLLLIGVMSSRFALADLTSASYMKARQAYKSEDWSTAAKLLRNYVSEDHVFLAKNPDVAEQISAAIAFCDRVITIERNSIGSVAAKDSDTAPALPNSPDRH
jgi:hypothetical protein